MSKNAKKDGEEEKVKNPIEWLMHAALMVLIATIALTLSLQLLASIWPWLVAIGVVVGGIAIWLRMGAAKRRDW